MKEPTEQEWQEVLEWCGFHKLDMPQSPWLYGELGNYSWKDYSLPPRDLNSLFEYAVPRALEHIRTKMDVSLARARGVLFRLWLRYYEKYREFEDEDALFWAIKQVIDSVRKVALRG